MRDARSLLSAMVEALDRNRNAEVLAVDVAAPASREDIVAASSLARGVLPAGVADFYAQMNGFRLEWRHTVAAIGRGDLSDHGSIGILPISEVFADWRGVTWFGEDDDDEFRAVKPFDMFVPEACAAFVQPEGEPPAASVAYHYFGEELHDTGYSFDEYLVRMLASRGFWYWIKTLCPGLEHSAEVTAFRRAMPRIFADYDDSLFQPGQPRSG
jgi:hypothetical protein